MITQAIRNTFIQFSNDLFLWIMGCVGRLEQPSNTGPLLKAYIIFGGSFGSAVDERRGISVGRDVFGDTFGSVEDEKTKKIVLGLCIWWLILLGSCYG